MYVQIDYALRTTIQQGLNTKLNNTFTKWQDEFNKKHPGLAWKILRHMLPAEYDEFWRLHDKVIANKTHWGAQTISTMPLGTHLDMLQQITLPIPPPLRVLYGHNLANYSKVPGLTLADVFKLAPEIVPDFEVLKMMNEDHRILREAMNNALNHTSLGVALNKASFLTEFVPAEYLSKLHAKAERKPKPPKAKPEEITDEQQQAMLIAATRLKIQD